MCGIVGYIGKNKALPIILNGLRSMEYRGYDSCGVSVLEPNGEVKTEKSLGKVDNLEQKISDNNFFGTLGCGHERWATHGGVTIENTHPHHDCAGQIWVVHNGIIENHRELKSDLLSKNHNFVSETDTEVIAHLIEEFQKQDHELESSIREALKKIKGTYGLIIMDSKKSDMLIAARNFSPLILGLGQEENFIASDSSAVLKYTTKVVYLDDGEMAVVTRNDYKIYDLGWNLHEKQSEELTWTPEEAQKDGFPYFMLKEICAEPEAVINSTRGRLIIKEGLSKLGGLEGVRSDLKKAERILITACGTSYYAGKVGEYMLEEYAGIPVEVDMASEFRYRKPVFKDKDIIIALSQSGETADTIAALREAKEKDILSLGIVNVVGSTIARDTDAGVYQHIGPEISVASTKAFVSQVSILVLITMLLGRERQMSITTGERIAKELTAIPDLINKILEKKDHIKELTEKYLKYDNFLYLGRKYNMPVALEGALKLKEIAYVHAEGCAAGEMKHGPIAMIDKNFPSICIVPRDSVYEKTISNVEEIKARNGPIIAIATEGDNDVRDITDDIIYIPKTLEMLTPLLTVIPLQLFAYYFSVLKGNNVDRPRNLAKSVTVE
jgi:glutamine---fructose-6-phosphate transaminase (isomerizing)